MEKYVVIIHRDHFCLIGLFGNFHGIKMDVLGVAECYFFTYKEITNIFNIQFLIS